MFALLKPSAVGLNYDGLPLAVALARHCGVTGFDVDQSRIAELDAFVDRTGEVELSALADSALSTSRDPAELEAGDRPFQIEYSGIGWHPSLQRSSDL